MAEDVTDDLSGLGKAIAIPAYARGAAGEMVGVERFKRESGTRPQTHATGTQGALMRIS